MTTDLTAADVLPDLAKALQLLRISAKYRVTTGKGRPQLDFPGGGYLIYFRGTGNYKLFLPGKEPGQHLLEAGEQGAIAEQIKQILGSYQ